MKKNPPSKGSPLVITSNHKPPAYRPWLVSTVLVVVFTISASYTFNSRVQIYGDNTTYYTLGKALAHNEGFVDIHHATKTKHHHYPPGYPAFMSLVMRIAGSDMLTQKYANTVVLGLGVWLLFWLAYRITENLALSFVIGIFTAINPSLLQFGSTMMSEVLFFTLSISALLLFLHWQKQPHWGWIVGVVVLLAATYYVRSLGIALAVGVFGSLLFSRAWKKLIIAGAGFVLLILPWQLRNASLGSSYIKQLMLKNPYQKQLGSMEGMDWLTRIWENLERYITREVPNGIFRFVRQTNFDTPSFSEWVGGLFILLLIGYGLYKTPKYRKVMLYYMLATGGILLLWPQVWFGVRFILPLIPILLLYGFQGVYQGLALIGNLLGRKKAIPGWTVLLLLVFTRAYATPIKNLHQDSKLPISAIYKHYYSIAAWVRENTSPESVVVCRKQSLFYVHADRFVAGFPRSEDHAAILQDFIDKGVDYVVVDAMGYSDVAQYLVPTIQENPHYFQIRIALENPNSYLLQFHPEGNYGLNLPN